MHKKFYVVWVGRKTGVFTSWPQTKSLVDKFPAAKYKSFTTLAEAQSAYEAGWQVLSGREIDKKNTPKNKKLSLSSHKTADVNQATLFDVLVFCDGACDPNPGKAASGIAVYRQQVLIELWYGLYNPHGTNNTAELNALYQALLIAQKAIDTNKTVQILCDSKYTINCITVWAYTWKKKGWKRQKDGDIKNLEIICRAHDLYTVLKDRVTISHVKAHAGIEGNELADRMSVFGIEQKENGFKRYTKPLDIEHILGLRSG